MSIRSLDILVKAKMPFGTCVNKKVRHFCQNQHAKWHLMN
jgi:hypothetical protein